MRGGSGIIKGKPIRPEELIFSSCSIYSLSFFARPILPEHVHLYKVGSPSWPVRGQQTKPPTIHRNYIRRLWKLQIQLIEIMTFQIGGKSQAKNAVLFQQTILRYFVHFWQHEKATRQSPAGSLCFIVLFPCYFRVLCVRFSLKYERAGAARPPPPSTRPAPCSHSARLKPFAGSCSSRFGFA